MPQPFSCVPRNCGIATPAIGGLRTPQLWGCVPRNRGVAYPATGGVTGNKLHRMGNYLINSNSLYFGNVHI
ncbi:hypothetical protein Barb4_03182 [Bacteroidales bacterium Barb4]|nr:hypothetical protein Barb4_03182 [Bacteroidales bacterium Barb4]